MNSNFRLFFSIVAVGAFMFSGCSNEKELPIENISVVEGGNVKPVQKAESNQPTTILGSGGSISSILSQTFTNIVDLSKARHVIISCTDLDTYKEDLLVAYKKGSVITVIDPDATKLDEWCAANGMVYAGDPTTANACSLISFNSKASSMSIQKRKQMDGIDDEDVPLVIFTDWLDKMLTPTLKGPDYRSKEIKKRFTPQHVKQVFPINLSKEEIQRIQWGLPETASLSTTAELNCDIYPIHSFADNSFTGDIYAVEAELIIHNGNLYNGRWQYTRGKSLYEVCGFYLNQFRFKAGLYKKEGDIFGGVQTQLMGGPAPAATDASAAYQSGFEWNFDGWLTGGNGLESSTPTPLQQGVWTWSNLQENGSGLNISVEDASVWPEWTVEVDGCPTKKEDAIPEMSSGDLTFRCSWIWGVPEAVDDSTERYYMTASLIEAAYCWHRSSGSSSKINIEYLMSPNSPSVCFMLIPPSRIEGQRL
ncbi:MAG: hypothetical protein K2N35_05825 [Muribaculaceae bacterium]|nr:hypothetical protein [Muribaculaceae bacterium]